MDLLLTYALWFLVYLFVIWVFFVVAIRSRNELEERFDNNKYIMGLFDISIGLPFVIGDFILNLLMTFIYTLLRIKRLGLLKAFIESLPDFAGARKHVPLYTHRLRQTILNDPLDSATLRFSVWICKYLVEPHDAGHCALFNLRLRKERGRMGPHRY